MMKVFPYPGMDGSFVVVIDGKQVLYEVNAISREVREHADAIVVVKELPFMGEVNGVIVKDRFDKLTSPIQFVNMFYENVPFITLEQWREARQKTYERTFKDNPTEDDFTKVGDLKGHANQPRLSPEDMRFGVASMKVTGSIKELVEAARASERADIVKRLRDMADISIIGREPYMTEGTIRRKALLDAAERIEKT